MRKIDTIEKDYWWEIKSYLENPSKEALVDLLEQVYEEGYEQGRYDYG
jgi:hypothetical protein